VLAQNEDMLSCGWATERLQLVCKVLTGAGFEFTAFTESDRSNEDIR